jgi:hypothetical protein
MISEIMRQGQIKARLEKLFPCWVIRRNNTGAYFRNGRMIKYGDPGSPDIECIATNGRYVGIETKTEEGKLSDAQIEYHKRVRTIGGIVIVARHWDDVEGGLEEADLL